MNYSCFMCMCLSAVARAGRSEREKVLKRLGYVRPSHRDQPESLGIDLHMKSLVERFPKGGTMQGRHSMHELNELGRSYLSPNGSPTKEQHTFVLNSTNSGSLLETVSREQYVNQFTRQINGLVQSIQEGLLQTNSSCLTCITKTKYPAHDFWESHKTDIQSAVFVASITESTINTESVLNAIETSLARELDKDIKETLNTIVDGFLKKNLVRINDTLENLNSPDVAVVSEVPQQWATFLQHQCIVSGSGSHGAVCIVDSKKSTFTVAVKTPISLREQTLFFGEGGPPFRHFHISDIYGGGPIAPLNSPRIAMVMEAASGGSLESAIEKKTLSEKHKITAILETMSALVYMHHLGFVHGDVALENIVLSSDCSPGPCYAELVDFAHTREVDTHGARGLLIYSPPEVVTPDQMEELALPAKVTYDTWSFGVSVYEIMNDGRLPPCIWRAIKRASEKFPDSWERQKKDHKFLLLKAGITHNNCLYFELESPRVTNQSEEVNTETTKPDEISAYIRAQNTFIARLLTIQPNSRLILEAEEAWALAKTWASAAGFPNLVNEVLQHPKTLDKTRLPENEIPEILFQLPDVKK